MKRLILLVLLALVGFGAYWYLTSDNVSVEVRDAVRMTLEETGGAISEKTAEIKKTVTTPPPLRKALTGKLGEDLSIQGILEWTNTHRSENGLGSLTLNAQLNAAAKAKLDDMFAGQYFEHVSPNGTGPSDDVEAAGYDFIAVGENLALGNFDDDKALVQAWMDSPGHRANILGADFREIGIAVGKGTFDGQTTWIAVQEFGRPLSDCPEPESSLAKLIATNKANLETMSNEASTRKADIDATPEPKNRKEANAYNEKVNAYNDLVRRINALISEIQGEITIYNGQVQAFNSCAAG